LIIFMPPIGGVGGLRESGFPLKVAKTVSRENFAVGKIR
jgi:hypothetical protein